ncbi:S41 family peptidase [Flavobacterium haoranii]|uniref:Carboxyl-terminal processing protease n=1 Tax=Flavobacterium haoranii TaxID=683124 RepID=A0A1M6EKN5_9FLAO|nr:S41 family peptidase [Flavobacterium haoranii]SHI86061.1 carboxyl-terminal processing protease [Flavobacterium haoranii]
MRLFKKHYIITIFAVAFLFIGASFKNDFFEIAKQIEIFTTMFKTVNQNYVDETNPGELIDVAIKNMLSELDPYTVFFNEQDVVRFKINNTGEYTGIGALIQRKDGIITLKEVYKGFAADLAGLKAGDEIFQIDDINLKEYKEDTSQLLRGSKNSTVNVQYTRQGKKLATKVTLKEVELKAVPYYQLLDNSVGYIVLTKFTETASRETRDALIDLKNQGAQKIILDLRGNPGGLLHEAINICNFFVPKNEVIVTTKSKNEKHNQTYRTRNEPIDLEIPLAVIVDGKSASASEIVSGALQDLDRAVVIGSRSFGKGLVQRPLNLSYGTQVKVTISRYYTPSGRCIQALDYSKRDANGKAVKKSKDEFNAFKTKSGRTVYDGGGIQPDVEIAESKTSSITKALVDNNAVFDFATQLYYQKPNNASVSDADFTAFKTFVKQDKYKLNTATEQALENVLEKAKKDKIDDVIAAQYKQLEQAVKASEENEIVKYKKEIVKEIEEELIIRNQYREGLYNFYTKNNSEISKAKEILNNSAQYSNLLK